MEYQTIYESLGDDDVNEIKSNLIKLKKNISNLKIQTLLNEESDSANAFIEIHAGAGGTESQDWAEMLERMYLKFCDKNNYSYELIDRQKGEEAGIKSSTYLIKGFKAFGYLKNESGIHRLVRISPFDSNSRRHTSFSSIWIYPEVDENIDIEINLKDLRIDTFRASGAGGQHINTTDSAIRITHTKLNIVVQSQAERSQHRNKDTAMKMLKSKIYEYELSKKNEKKTELQTGKKEIGWGHQIRSYVLHPYRMIKDLRTNYQSSNTESVLDGNIFEFLESSLVNVKKH
jgi:peptide chain release factor 2|tara:strand:- start:261 stop:1124 length:864 start_codon:yes stop_codon:yes gene_type:complete